MKKTILRVVALALLAVMMCMALVACAPASDPDKAEKALEKKDYEVKHADDKLEAAFMGGWYDGCEDVILAYNEESEDVIYIWYFDDKDSANEAWDDIEKYAEELNEEAKEEDIDIVCKKSGKMIYIGTKQAVKDAR